jgi:membrane-bound serine protease (ClpP class)
MWTNTITFFWVVGIGMAVFAGIVVYFIFTSFVLKHKHQTGTADATVETKQHLEGAIGVAATDLRPMGIGLFDGKRIDVISGGKLIKKDSTIRIVSIEGTKVVVEEMGSSW